MAEIAHSQRLLRVRLVCRGCKFRPFSHANSPRLSIVCVYAWRFWPIVSAFVFSQRKLSLSASIHNTPGFRWMSPDREIRSQSQRCERIDLNLGGSLILGFVIRSTYSGLILRLDVPWFLESGVQAYRLERCNDEVLLVWSFRCFVFVFCETHDHSSHAQHCRQGSRRP